HREDGLQRNGDTAGNAALHDRLHETVNHGAAGEYRHGEEAEDGQTEVDDDDKVYAEHEDDEEGAGHGMDNADGAAHVAGANGIGAVEQTAEREVGLVDHRDKLLPGRGMEGGELLDQHAHHPLLFAQAVGLEAGAHAADGDKL